MMARFRKKPIVVEAVQVPPLMNIDERVELDDWLVANKGERPCGYVGSKIRISTLEGDMFAQVGDWIIKGVEGELYPCNSDIFVQTYEPVEPTPITSGDG